MPVLYFLAAFGILVARMVMTFALPESGLDQFTNNLLTLCTVGLALVGCYVANGYSVD